MKAVFTPYDVEQNCDVCDVDLQGDPYKLDINGCTFRVCDNCYPNIAEILQAAGVEVEMPDRELPRVSRPGWKV